MKELSKILLRLTLDLAGNAATAAVERLHDACDAYLFTPEQRAASKTAREQTATAAMCSRYVASARERRAAS